MRKYVILAASVGIGVVLGGIYAWSEFVPSLRAAYGLTPTQTQVIYGVNVGSFTLALVLGGRLLGRLGPRPITAAGGVLFALGWLAASASGGDFWVLLASVGIVVAVGIALGYICLLSTAVLWFPHRKGLVAGLTMAGFGSGAILLAQAANYVLPRGVGVLTVFRWIGLIGGPLVVLSAMAIDRPRNLPPPAPAHLTRFRSLVRQRRFWSLVAGFAGATFAGQLVIGNLKSIALWAGLDATWAAVPVSAFAAGSASGRLAWGWLHDRLGRNVVPASAALLGAAVAALWASGSPAAGFVAAAFAVGFCFGSNFVLYAAETARDYGPHAVATVYPCVFLCYVLSGTGGPVVGGWLYGLTGSYAPALLSAAIAAAGGAAAHVLLRPPAHVV